MTPATAATLAIAGLATAGVIARPMRWPEWIWAVAGAVLLVSLGLLPIAAAGAAIGKGADVYLFLTGMMLLSEAAREHGVFDRVAASAVNHARGSGARLFALIYLAGVAVTVLMSNDATAVVLTPAVFAVARRAGADPRPLLLACALVANAASFVLPISNPANLVLYGGALPRLGAWLGAFALPSLAAILVTALALGWLERRRIAAPCACDVPTPTLSAAGRTALVCIGLTAVLLIAMSALDRPLGPPAALAGIATALAVSAMARASPVVLARGVSWGVLALVAGLFVLVEALGRTGAIDAIAQMLARAAINGDRGAAMAGTVLAVAANLTNNLPAGLVAADAIARAQPPQLVVDALLIGVDLGPNLSVTGSLATILWLQAIRREGQEVSFLTFLKVGVVAMPPALAAALAARLLV